MPNCICFAPSVRVNELNHFKIRIWHGTGFGNSQGVSLDHLDGPPHVDDLHAALEELVSLVGEVMGHAGESCAVGLVDVDALDWTSECAALGVVVWRLVTDSVVEDEDSRGAGAAQMIV